MNSATPHKIAIAGIHTGIGKTIVSAVLTEALGADYWKPVQAGLEERDTDLVGSLISNGEQRVHPEAVMLKNPMSPHAAAEIEGIKIDYERFTFPETANKLIIETAGGIHSPISATKTMADFIAHYNLPVVLVSQNYLGSINHTIATIEVLRSRNIPILGLIINGAENAASESFIEQYTSVNVLARIPHFTNLTHSAIATCAAHVKPELLNKLS